MELKWEILKLVMCLWILLFLSNRSIANFCGWRWREGHRIDAFLLEVIKVRPLSLLFFT